MICFVERDPETGHPSLPDAVQALLLAEPCHGASWAVFDLEASEPPPSCEPVPKALAVLLRAAKGYPPALARMRVRVARDNSARREGECPSREEHAERLCGILEEYLAGGPLLGHFLARNVVDEPGVRSEGAFYWVTAYDPREDVVTWISDEYEVRASAAEGFVLDGHMMAALVEKQILESCSHDAEVFYFPFAKVNYGGQVFRRQDGRGRARYVDEGEWPISFDGEAVSDAIERLVRAGLMRCWRLSSEEGVDREEIHAPDEDEFDLYRDYDCVTFADHEAHLGYGPHELITTDEGLQALGLPPRA